MCARKTKQRGRKKQRISDLLPFKSDLTTETLRKPHIFKAVAKYHVATQLPRRARSLWRSLPASSLLKRHLLHTELTQPGVQPSPPPPSPPSPLPAAASHNEMSPPRDSDPRDVPGASWKAPREKRLHIRVTGCEAAAPRGAHAAGHRAKSWAPRSHAPGHR